MVQHYTTTPMAAKFANRTFRVNVDSDNFNPGYRQLPCVPRFRPFNLSWIVQLLMPVVTATFYSVGIRMEVDQDIKAQATLD